MDGLEGQSVLSEFAAVQALLHTHARGGVRARATQVHVLLICSSALADIRPGPPRQRNLDPDQVLTRIKWHF